jgi:hypothetical protein
VPETFVSTYLKHTEIYESPTSFWKWSAYATIAAILRDNCYFPQGDSRLYPNIYVMFLAESSGHRKGRPVDLSQTLSCRINNTKIISGRTSVQAILDELARAETDRKTGKVAKVGSAIFFASELAAGIVADPAALEILTDIYDYKPNPYKNMLRTGPKFNLDKIVFTMLVASNEDMIKGFFNTVAIKGGMLARTFLVTPNEFRKPNDLMDLDTEERKSSLARVTDQLFQVAKLEGSFTIDFDAKLEYRKWYNPFREQYATKKESSGIVGRVHSHVIKVAMLKAANELRYNINKEDIEESIIECLNLMPNYSIFTMSNGRSEQGQAGGQVIVELMNSPSYTISRKDLLRKIWMNVDSDTLDKIMVTLEQAGMVQQIQCRDGLYFKLTQQCLEIMGQQKT